MSEDRIRVDDRIIYKYTPSKCLNCKYFNSRVLDMPEDPNESRVTGVCEWDGDWSIPVDGESYCDEYSKERD